MSFPGIGQPAFRQPIQLPSLKIPETSSESYAEEENTLPPPTLPTHYENYDPSPRQSSDEPKEEVSYQPQGMSVSDHYFQPNQVSPNIHGPAPLIPTYLQPNSYYVTPNGNVQDMRRRVSFQGHIPIYPSTPRANSDEGFFSGIANFLFG